MNKKQVRDKARELSVFSEIHPTDKRKNNMKENENKPKNDNIITPISEPTATVNKPVATVASVSNKARNEADPTIEGDDRTTQSATSNTDDKIDPSPDKIVKPPSSDTSTAASNMTQTLTKEAITTTSSPPLPPISESTPLSNNQPIDNCDETSQASGSLDFTTGTRYTTKSAAINLKGPGRAVKAPKIVVTGAPGSGKWS